MATSTPNLHLFKYNTETDGKEVFSIETALNQNWDILDANSSGCTTTVSGTTWSRVWNDGWKEQGGLVAMADGEVDFVMPILTENGTLGGNTYAAYTNSTFTSEGSMAYKMFDGDTTTYWAANQTLSEYVIFYSPIGIRLTGIVYINHIVGGGCLFNLYGSNDNSTWTFLTGVSSATETYQTASVVTDQYFKYFRMSVARYDGRPKFVELQFQGKCKVNSANTITFPLAFNNTNYSYTFACQDGGGLDAYVSNKTVTGMTLSNTQSGSASWTACGY